MTISNIILIVIIILLALYCSRLKLREQPQEENVSQLNAPKLHISNNDIMQYIRDFANKFTPVMENKGIEFVVKCRPESMMGWIDTDKIDKVLLLIISDMAGNATTGGKITIDVDTDQNYSRVFIRIRDNGPAKDRSLALQQMLKGTGELKYSNTMDTNYLYLTCKAV